MAINCIVNYWEIIADNLKPLSRHALNRINKVFADRFRPVIPQRTETTSTPMIFAGAGLVNVHFSFPLKQSRASA
jgi:hypothetical protein